MRALKLLVIAMGVAIIAGVGVLVTVIATRLGDRPAPGSAGTLSPAAAADVTADVPAGARLIQHSLAGDRLVLDLALPDGGRALAVIDVATGRRLALVRVPGS